MGLWAEANAEAIVSDKMSTSAKRFMLKAENKRVWVVLGKDRTVSNELDRRQCRSLGRNPAQTGFYKESRFRQFDLNF